MFEFKYPRPRIGELGDGKESTEAVRESGIQSQSRTVSTDTDRGEVGMYDPSTGHRDESLDRRDDRTDGPATQRRQTGLQGTRGGDVKKFH